MKTKYYGAILIALGLLTGCGNNSAEETAIDFAEAISSANLDSAREVSTDSVHKKIKRLEKICLQKEVNELANIAIPILNTLDQNVRSGKYDDELNEVKEEFKKDTDTLKQTFMHNIQEKYGSMEQVPKDEREKITKESLVAFAKISMPLVEKEFELFKIKTKREDEVKKIAAQFMLEGRTRVTYNNRNHVKEIVREILLKQNIKPSQQCIDAYSDYGIIDDINFIELKQKSPDKAIVRLELIREDKKSKKVSVDVEKIQEEWKVSRFSIGGYF